MAGEEAATAEVEVTGVGAGVAIVWEAWALASAAFSGT